jgi:serine/threonine protein phosphatase PrpC
MGTPKAGCAMRIGHTAVATHTGRKRRRNEDAYVFEPPLFAVADGMGGARAGDVASRLAAAAVKAGEAGGNGKERVIALIQQANRSVYERSSEDAAAAGMGTTMTVALVEDSVVTFGHVGDSRAYVLRDGALEQLTDDHSLVAELVRVGKLSPEEAESHPQRSVVTRVLGTDPDVDVDTFTVAGRPGDVFLICSDGLTTMVGDDDIVGVLTERRNLDDAAKELVRLANKAGGEDNITVVAFDLTDEPGEPDEPDEETVEQTQPMPAVGIDEDTREDVPEESKRRGVFSRFLPLLLLLGAIAAAAIVLWELAR